MTLVELSFIAIAFIGVFGVVGIAAVVTGRTPKALTKRLNWNKMKKKFKPMDLLK
jgi:K+-transporting ATPase A subunit